VAHVRSATTPGAKGAADAEYGLMSAARLGSARVAQLVCQLHADRKLGLWPSPSLASSAPSWPPAGGARASRLRESAQTAAEAVELLTGRRYAAIVADLEHADGGGPVLTG
jgi:hypothetical protein